MGNTLKQKKPIQKQNIIHIYNQLTKQIYGSGISSHKIEVNENRLMIFAIHKRIMALKLMRANFPELVSYANTAIFAEFKTRLKDELKKELRLPITTILMDYDANTQHTCTIVYFDVNSL